MWISFHSFLIDSKVNYSLLHLVSVQLVPPEIVGTDCSSVNSEHTVAHGSYFNDSMIK